CPVCRHDDTKVIDSRPADEGAAIRRRRSCPECSYRFTTYERLEGAPLMVLKRSGNRQPFDRAKVADGIRSACKGRPVPDEMVEELAEAVEDDVRLEAAAGKDITSSLVGHCVLERLRTVDEVAYMRFASVYKNFDDASDFRRELALLKKS
ncbi:MAG: transcriptional repressor NrdR, partial [Actinobacteria bacterium]|nr:transcriptional repressor NrdR [Actinomycetota bacterium]